MVSYYNEIDPKAAAWLRELIRRGLIADGDVDNRSIEDVVPNDLRGYTRCHFFSGIGTWAYALDRARWPAGRIVWTGSCPCQPFSAAGKGDGFADERHLWPAFFHLIAECNPPVVFGEQVASKAADPWVDLVQTDLEAVGYAFGAVPFPSAGVGAPHIRDRTYWVADDAEQGWLARGRAGGSSDGRRPSRLEPGRLRDAGRLAHHHHNERLDFIAANWRGAYDPGPTNGLWRDADWLLCRDGKWRPVEPGTFPLAHGAPARVGRLRGYGNAINAEAAVAWIESYLAS